MNLDDNKTAGDILHDLSLIDPVVKMYYHVMRAAKTPDEVTTAWTQMTKQLVKDKEHLNKTIKNMLSFGRSHGYIIVTQEIYNNMHQKVNDEPR